MLKVIKITFIVKFSLPRLIGKNARSLIQQTGCGSGPHTWDWNPYYSECGRASVRSGSGTGKWELSIVQIRVLLLQLCDKPSNTVAKGSLLGRDLLCCSLLFLQYPITRKSCYPLLRRLERMLTEGRKEGNYKIQTVRALRSTTRFGPNKPVAGKKAIDNLIFWWLTMIFWRTFEDNQGFLRPIQSPNSLRD